MPEKKAKVKLGLKSLETLQSYFDCIFVHLRQKVRLRPKLSPKFLSTLGTNPTRKGRPDLQLWSDHDTRRLSHILYVLKYFLFDPN